MGPDPARACDTAPSIKGERIADGNAREAARHHVTPSSSLFSCAPFPFRARYSRFVRAMPSSWFFRGHYERLIYSGSVSGKAAGTNRHHVHESHMQSIDKGEWSRSPASLSPRRGRAASQDQQPPDISVIMPTVFWSGTFERCARRVLSLLDSTTTNTEVVFVFDGAAPPAPGWLDRSDVRIVQTGNRSGPAIARNLAAESARGEILFFVDADVELAADAIDRVHATFMADPELVGLFGAYDDEPAADGMASAFRNLLHHHTHVSHPGTAGTFWSGCGAMRTTAFLDVGGFDEKYAYPSVEDIELGMRVAANGGRILLAPTVRCKHLKRWTLASMVFTDIVHRAAPWTHLIMNSKELPATLNLDWRGRLSGICSVLLAVCLAASMFVPMMLWAALACGLVVVALNRDFYRLCLRKRGVGFAVSSISLHWLYFVYSSLTFGVVTLYELWRRSRRSTGARSRDFQPAAATAAMMLSTEVSQLPPLGP
jgi:glycosyltransferase involved in cell wall biosynthesis